MKRFLHWLVDCTDAMSGLAVITAFALVSWVYWADVIQTPAQLRSFFGLVILLAALFGVFHALMLHERGRIVQQQLDRVCAECCDYHDSSLYRVRLERIRAERAHDRMAELYARKEMKDSRDDNLPDLAFSRFHDERYYDLLRQLGHSC